MSQEKPELPIDSLRSSNSESTPDETLSTPSLETKRKLELEKEAHRRAQQLIDEINAIQPEPAEETEDSDPLSATEGEMKISLDPETIKKFLIEQGLSEEQISDLKIEFTTLPWSNRLTRSVAGLLPERLKEIFTRIESLQGDTLKIFTNNLEAIYDPNDQETIIRDTVHHLAHYVQKKKGAGVLTRLITRLPIIHRLSKHEREARQIANSVDLQNSPLANLVQFSNQKKSNGRLKIKV